MDKDFQFVNGLAQSELVAIWCLDEHNRTQFVNAKAVSLSGHNEAFLYKQHILDFVEQKDTLKSWLATACQKKTPAGHIDLIHKSGDKIELQAIVWPVFAHAQYKGIALLLLEDKKSRATQRELLVLQEKLSLFNQTTTDVLIIHKGSQIIEANQAACQLLEVDSEQIRQVDFFRFMSTSDRQNFQKQHHLTCIDNQLIQLISDSGKQYQCQLSSCLTELDGESVRVTLIKDISQMAHIHSELAKIEQTNQALIESAPDAIVLFDPHHFQILQTNSKASSLFGIHQDELIGSPFSRLLVKHTDNQPAQFAQLLRQALSCLSPCGYLKMRHSSGAQIECEARLVMINWQGRQLIRASLFDVSAQKQQQEKMHQLSSALEQTADLILITDKNGTIEYANQAVVSTTGYQMEEIIGQNPKIFNSGKHDTEFIKQLWETILAGEPFRRTIANRKQSGELYYEEKTISPIKNEFGDITHFVSTGKDITARIIAQESLEHLAFHDVLTGLPNRALFNDRLKSGLAQAKRQHKKLALLFFDVDRFKRINDTLGHEVGDILLKQIADKLRKRFRDSDTIARLGGDEFAVIMNQIEDETAIKRTAKQIIKLFNQPIKLEDREFYISTSIGISIFPQDGDSGQSLLKHADVAMYRAKAQGRNTFMFYREEMNAHAFERLQLESELHRALKNKEFIPYYQPKLCLSTGKVIGVEALMRWRHPELGLLLPERFIPVLESTGLIVPVGYGLIEQSIRDYQNWLSEGMTACGLSINLSALQLKDLKFIESFKCMLADLPDGDHNIEFEITENTMMTEQDGALLVMQQLRHLGVNLSIDDFGTGYSSLAHLKNMPVQTIKIDHSFIQDIGTQSEDEVIVRTVIAMAKSLGYQIVAEGIETLEQVKFLTDLGCDIGQGFLFSEAIPGSEIIEYCAKNSPVSLPH